MEFPVTSENEDSLVYVLEADCDPSRYKIGVTSGKISSRISALQTGCPWKLTLIKKISGTRNLESRLHKQFAHRRVSGGWFELDEDDVRWLRGLEPVSTNRLACLWVKEIVPEPRRAAVVAGLLLDTFDLSSTEVAELVDAWLGDVGVGEKAVCVALKRRRLPPPEADSVVLRGWLLNSVSQHGPDWLFTIGQAIEGAGFSSGKKTEISVSKDLLDLGAEKIGKKYWRGRQGRWWKPPSPMIHDLKFGDEVDDVRSWVLARTTPFTVGDVIVACDVVAGKVAENMARSIMKEAGCVYMTQTSINGRKGRYWSPPSP